MKALTDSLRDLSGRADLPLLIDQEGGRVARMVPPEWPAFPAGATFDALYDVAPISAIEAARANAQALALMLAEVGVNVNCAPLLDVRQADVTPAIGDRSFGGDPMRVAALGQAMLEGMRRGGVVGVVKHMAAHWSTAITICRASRPMPRRWRRIWSRSSGWPMRRWG